MQPHPDHPIPLGCHDPEYLSDGAYVSHDGMTVWVSCDRDGVLHAVALDAAAIRELVRYAKRVGGCA